MLPKQCQIYLDWKLLIKVVIANEVYCFFRFVRMMLKLELYGFPFFVILMIVSVSLHNFSFVSFFAG